MADNDKCGAEIATDDGTETFGPCDRDTRRHIVHRDSDGTKYVKVPGGVIAPKKK